MKNLKTLFCSLLAATLMVGCTDYIAPDPDKPNIIEGDGDGFFMSLDVLMPNGAGSTYSRSHTTEGGGSSGGTEVGQDEENSVSSALIVLARRTNYGFIAAGEVRSNNLTPTNVTAGANNEKAYRALTRIYKTNLAAYYELIDNPNVNPTVLVFVFCNPTKQLTDMFKGDRTPFNSTSWINTAARVTQGLQDETDYNVGIWAPHSFLMNNVSLTERILPKNLMEWESFNKSDNPFHLSAPNATADNPDLPNNGGVEDGGTGGAVRVERSVARFDFKDGSPLGNNSYNVLYHAHDGIPQDGTNGTNNEPLVKVQIQKMCLVNMSNSFYYLPRVSDDGLPVGTDSDGNPTGANWTLCGFEQKASLNDKTGAYTGGNYVVGPYAKQFEGDIETNFSQYFNYPFFEDNGEFNVESQAYSRWDVYKLKDVLNNGLKDNYNGTSNYNRWRYVVENVIPGGPSNQVNGISTGIVFKARILGTDYAMTQAVNDAVEPWEKNTYSQIANCLNGKPYIQTDGSTHPAITGNSTDDPIIYYYDGKLFLTWRHIRQAAIQASVSLNDLAVNGVEINRSNSLYRAVFGDGGIPDGNVYMNGTTLVKFSDPDFANREADYKESPDYYWNTWVAAGKPVTNSSSKLDVPETLANFRLAATDAGITIFQSSVDRDAEFGPGYYCYYYYWNRHNNNNLDGVMGPMEFDVVRNNVYKLSVDKISRLGHPRIPMNDPENPTPTTPDETDQIYLDVTVEIVPWAVRVNSITF